MHRPGIRQQAKQQIGTRARFVFLFTTALALGALALCQAASPAQAQTAEPHRTHGRWHSSKIGGSGYILGTAISPTDPDRFYAWTDIGGLYASGDGGSTWTMLHASPSWPRDEGSGAYGVRDLIIDPRDPEVVLAAVGDRFEAPVGVMRSADGGQSWERVLDGAYFVGNGSARHAGHLLARSPATPDTVVAASIGGGLWRSVDNGATWAKTSFPEGVHPTDVLFDRNDPDHLWLAARDIEGFFFNPDVGYVTERSFTGGYYQSFDGGETWEETRAEEGPTEFEQDPQDPDRLYAIWDYKTVYRSLDDGATWEDMREGFSEFYPEGELSEEEEDFISPDPLRLASLVAGDDFMLFGNTAGGGILRMPAMGEEWTYVSRDAVDYTYEGETWFAEGNQFDPFAAMMSTLTIDPENPDRWFTTDWYGIYETTDAGSTFDLSMDGVEMTWATQLVADPSDPSRVYLAAADHGFFRSGDGGERFEKPGELTSADPAINVRSIAVSPARPERLYLIGDGLEGLDRAATTLYRSDDRGTTWSEAAMNGLPDPQTTGTRFATAAANPNDADEVYLTASGSVGAGGGGIYKSTDGGDSWSWMGEGLPQSDGDFFSARMYNYGPHLAVGAGGDLVAVSGPEQRGEAYRYDAEAEQWQQAPLSDGAAAVVAHPSEAGVFFVVAQGGVYRSGDGGQSWEQLFEAPAEARYLAVTSPEPAVLGLAVSTTAGVHLSSDGGETWDDLSASLPRVDTPRPAFAGNRLLLGTEGSGALWTTLEAPLPVELTDLEAQWDGEHVALSWRTLSETASAGFEVWRKVEDGAAGSEEAEGTGAAFEQDGFEQIHFAPSQAEGGTSAAAQSYRFTDRAVPGGAERVTYRLVQVDRDGTKTPSAPVTAEVAAPQAFALSGSYPNPFRSEATIRYALAQEAQVTLAVYDALGRKVRTLVAEERQPARRHTVRFAAEGLASGVYFVRLVAETESGQRTASSKITLVR